MTTRLRSFLRALVGRRRFEDAMRAELSFHIEACADDLERSGLPRDEALRRARLAFGAAEAVKDDCRQARGLRLLDELRQDVRYAIRVMARTPGFTTAAVLSLALGIGANTAIFSLTDAVLLRTLPVGRPHELVFLAHGSGDRPGTSSNYPLFERYASLTDVFTGVAAFSTTGFKVPAPDGIDAVDGLWVTGNFHALVGVPMALGRGFAAEPDRRPGGSLVAVISDKYWSRRFGRDPNVLGQSLRLDGRTIEIVGVTAPEFTGLVPGTSPDVTLPVSVRALAEPEYLDMHDSWTGLVIVGRLKPGVDAEHAERLVDVAFQQYMSAEENDWIRKRDPQAFDIARVLAAGRGTAGLRQRYEMPLTVLMAMVGVVLLIASTNVANLLLVRSTARAREVAIRLCVGGARARLSRQFLTESLLLAGAGAALGWLFALYGTGIILAPFGALEAPVVIDASPNLRVLAFTTALCVVTGLMFGLVPAVAGTRIDLTSALRDGVRAGHTARGWRSGHVLVAGQLALSVLVVAVAALLVRSLHNLRTIDAGFSGENVLLFTIDSYATPLPADRRAALTDEMLERLGTIPGVAKAVAARSTPIHTSGNARALHAPGASETMDGRAAWMNFTTPGYFDVFGITLLRGRDFDEGDRNGAPKVAIINQTLATFLFGDRDPLGQTLAFMTEPEEKFLVIGLTEDTYQMSLREPPPRMVYMPLAQLEERPFVTTFAVRTAQPPAEMLAAVREAARAVSRDVVLRYVRTMDEQVDASLVRERLLAGLSAAFAGLALLLAAIGLYGVLAYTVARKGREIGIRMALGARRATVLWEVLRQTLLVSIGGLAIGLVAAVLTTNVLESLLYGVSARDPITLAIVSLVLLVTASAAGWLPARRAAGVDPARMIRVE